ncbi:MAG: bifunctional phosphopantothenoylcysteine decarboxylase/phosphopantothenate--cysteine ligase CoaBC [Bacillota bacterium]
MSANIILGVTGGIAAYKMLSAASSLTKSGFNVYTIMTDSAAEFISPLTFHSITHLPVEKDLFSSWSSGEVKHIELADKADLCLVAPATANFIGKAASGIADDLLTTVTLAVQAPILIAPSMNVHMYENKIVQKNMKFLEEELNYKIITPESGYLACGYEGRGRLPEPEILVETVKMFLNKKDLKGKRVMISAGPTRERIDPVRYISNYSSGRMGYALARSAAFRGAEVTLVSGPVNIDKPLGVDIINVNSAEEMKNAVLQKFSKQDIVIMAAAVADYRPKEEKSEKIKKSDNNINLSLNLERTEDILFNLGQEKRNDQILIGFAAESESLLENARKKLKKKNADYIIANDISSKKIGFGSKNNQVSILSGEGVSEFPIMNKEKLADKIFDYIIDAERK